MLNELFYSYVDETEKEYMALESAFEIEMEKEQLALEYADRLYEIKLMESNARVLNESGTYEDIDTLYAEAATENAERKENIFKRIFAKIQKMASDLIEKIRKFFTKENMDTAKQNAKAEGVNEIEVTRDPKAILEAIKGAFKILGNMSVSLVTKDVDGKRVFDAEKTLKTTIAAAVAGGVAIKIKVDVVDKWIAELQKQINFISSTAKAWGDINASLLGVGYDKKAAKKEADAQLGTGVANKVCAILGYMTTTLNSTVGELQSKMNAFVTKRDTYKSMKKAGVPNPKEMTAQTLGESADDDMDFMESSEYEQTCEEIAGLIDNL